MSETGAGLELGWSDYQGLDCLRIHGGAGLEPGRLAVLPSALVGAAGGLQPVAGRLEVEIVDVCFIPRLPFVEGAHYSLLVDDSEAASIERPSVEQPATTRVLDIHPTAPEVPFNLLRLYVLFSSSMSEGWAARAVHVRRAADGVELADVFLPMDPELWDSRRRRLTLLLDPGRIKRGLVPNTEAGYPLSEGMEIAV